MLLSLKLFLLLIFLFEISCEDDCEPWPKELLPPKKCCHVPFAEESYEESMCSSKCYRAEVESRIKYKECVGDCFKNVTKLFKEDKTIDIEAVKRSPMLIPHSRQPEYRFEIDKVIDKCEYSSTGNISLDLAKYFDCLRHAIAGFCKNFDIYTNPGCDLVEEHIRKCKKIEPNCKTWASEFGYHSKCCEVPFLIKTEIAGQCEAKCVKSEYFLRLKKKCFVDCIISETKLIEDGKFNSEAAKTLLLENANKTEEWEKPIASVVEKCDAELQGLHYELELEVSSLNFYPKQKHRRHPSRLPT